MDILFIILGIIIGFALGWLTVILAKKTKGTAADKQLREMEAEKNKVIADLDKSKSIAEDRYNTLKADYDKKDEELKEERVKSEIQGNRLAKAETEFTNLRQKLAEQKTEMEALQNKLTAEFENISNKILKERSEEFSKLNLKNIGDILNPLKEKITDFEKKVNDAYDKEIRDKANLMGEVKKLYELNNKISEEANNLTKALKGDSRKQGNWGEIVLEKVLERSGLTKGVEYEIQYSTENDEGSRIRPDVVINLPDKKHIIIDSKVSLVAYERLVNAATEEERQKCIKEHLASIRNHIKGLSEKKYQSAKTLNSPDFVLLFIPIESSFSVAVQADAQLFSEAWEKNIVIVSPSTLLATLRTIASIWKQENQTRNAIEIARQGGLLFDKFVGFVEDLEKVGKQIGQLQVTYDTAMSKLKTGSGNLIGKAEALQKLGVKTSKHLAITAEENQQYALPEDTQ